MSRIASCQYQIDGSTITDIKPVNDSFALGTLYVMYTGDNPNKTSFDKPVVEAALPSIRNVPIVCHWDPDNQTIGGHDFTVASDANGVLRLRALTEPCGVVTESSTLSFVVMPDSEGIEHEYLKAENVVLWRRQDVIQYLEANKDVHVDHSMEIEILDEEKDANGIHNVKSFQFTALCLLGDCLPCFDGSRLELYSADDMKKQLEAMMNDLKKNYSLIVAAATGSNDIEESPKGGEESMNGENIENANAQVGATETETQTDKPADTATNNQVDAAAEAACAASTAAAEDYSLASNVRDALRNAVREKTIEKRWGEEFEYWFVDYDADAGMVYVEELEDGKLYGMPYTMDGDNVVIDFETKTRKKWAIVDYDEGSDADYYADAMVQRNAAIEEFVNKSDSEIAELKSSVESYEAKMADAEAELTELRQFKADAEAQKVSEAKEQVFALFSDLEGVEAFEALKSSDADMSIDALEEKCYAIRGRLATAAASSATYSDKSVKSKIGLDKTADENDATEAKPYGGVVERYTSK